MKVSFHGFRIYAGDGITLPEFGAILVAESSGKTEHEFNNHKRIFLCEDKIDADYYTGLLITAKDQKSFPQLRDEKGNLSIRVSELAKDTRLMDFNFFVLNKKTFCGLYQEYHFSLSLQQFGLFLKDMFWRPEREKRILAKTKELLRTGGYSPDHAEARAKKKFKKSMRFDLFFKPEDFLKIIKEMNEIRQFQFNASTKTARQKAFIPGLDIRKLQHQVTFDNPNAVANIAKGIGGFVKSKDIKRGKVMTVDAAGELRPVYLDRNIDGFGEFDFDDVVAGIELDLITDFAICPVINDLLEKVRAHPELFSDPDEG